MNRGNHDEYFFDTTTNPLTSTRLIIAEYNDTIARQVDLFLLDHIQLQSGSYSNRQRNPPEISKACQRIQHPRRETRWYHI